MKNFDTNKTTLIRILLGLYPAEVVNIIGRGSSKSFLSLLLILMPIYLFSQKHDVINYKLQKDKISFTPQFAGSSPIVKSLDERGSNQGRNGASSIASELRAVNESTSPVTWPQLMEKVNGSQILSDGAIYSGTYDQRAPQVAIDGNEIFVAFENYDTESGAYVYGTVQVYRSTNGGASWSFWSKVFHPNYHLYSPQIVVAGGHVVISFQVSGFILTARWRRSDQKFFAAGVASPSTNTSDYVVAHRMISDVELYPTSTWIYMAYLFKRADGKNRVFFCLSEDTAASWGTRSSGAYIREDFDSLGLAQTEIGKASIGFDFGRSGLYLSYLGTGANAGTIRMRKSTNLAKTWAPESELLSFGTNSKIGPIISVVGQRVAVVYQYDYNGTATDWKTAGTGGDFDVYATVSSDAGVTWKTRMVGSSFSNEILPSVSHDADSSFYISYIRDGKTRVSSAGNEIAFSNADSSNNNSSSFDDFTSIFGNNSSGGKNAFVTWAATSSGLDIFGSAVPLRVPPLSPSNVAAATVSNSQVNITWADNSLDETGFQILWYLHSTGTLINTATVGANTTSYSVNGLTTSTTEYDFSVRAFNANGYSINVFVNDLAAPTATEATNVQTTSFTANWITVNGATGYRIDVANDDGFIAMVSGYNNKDVANVSTCSVSGLSAGTTYYYRVRAYNSSSTSANSNVISVSPLQSVPTITSFNPAFGSVGTAVTISGTNFNPTPSNNIVYVGAVRAVVTSGTSTSLNVSIPHGTTYQPITITANGLTAYSQKPFITTYEGGGVINKVSFAPKIDFPTGMTPTGVNVGDMDGDGKPDILVTNDGSNTISIFRNIGSNNTIEFAAKVDFNVGAGPSCIALGDLDGDGKLDITVNSGDNAISILRNLSTMGNLSFASKVDFSVGTGPSNIAIGDIDGDGKPDVAVATVNTTTVFSIFRNTSSVGTISLSPRNDIQTDPNPFDVKIADIDGDIKPDLTVTSISYNNVSIFRNSSTRGSMSFAPKTSRATLGGPRCVAIVDIDGDGKLDFATTNSDSNSISVIRNLSASGSINIGSPKYFSAGHFPMNIDVGDIDGDGKPDIATVNNEGNNVTVFKNRSTIGNVDLASKVDFSVGNNPYDAVVVDINEDGRPDIIVSNNSDNSISVLRGTKDTIPPIITHTPTIVEVTVTNGNASPSVDIRASAVDAQSPVRLLQLQYIRTGEISISTKDFSVTDGTQDVQIPATAFLSTDNKAIGVDYRIAAWDEADNASFTSWYSIVVHNSSNVVDPMTPPCADKYPDMVKAYRIFSVPFDLDDKTPSFIVSSLGNHNSNDKDYFNWRLQRFVNGRKQDFNDFANEDAFKPGNGFFLIVRDTNKNITVGSNKIVKSDYMNTTGITLNDGWNIVGTPMNTTISFDDLVFVGGTYSDRAYYDGTGNHGGWWKQGDISEQSPWNFLKPWEGLAIKVIGTTILKFRTLSSPKIQNLNESDGKTILAKQREQENVKPAWMVTVDAYRTDNDMKFLGNGFGMAESAKSGDDPFDSYMPPVIGDRNIAVNFKNRDGAMMQDIRPLNNEGEVWDMQVFTGDAGANVKLQFGSVLNLPNPEFEVYVIDVDQSLAWNLKTVSMMEINSGNGTRNFKVVAGKKSFIEQNDAGVELYPTGMKLYSNYPNPFNPETTIRYTVPNASPIYSVTLKIFNVLGQEISTLVNAQQKSGYYEVRYSALKQTSGVYFYQIKVSDGTMIFSDVKKMMMLK